MYLGDEQDSWNIYLCSTVKDTTGLKPFSISVAILRQNSSWRHHYHTNEVRVLTNTRLSHMGIQLHTLMSALSEHYLWLQAG